MKQQVLFQLNFPSPTTPFFSVCTETTNRGKTIYRSLQSIARQTFRGFEYILVDNSSTDNSMAEVERFIASDEFKANPFPFYVLKNEKQLSGVKSWNEPLKYAKGKFIAVLEGDDEFQPTHLQKAFDFLTANTEVGIYATGSQRGLRPLQGLSSPQTYFQFNYAIRNVSPPSETIFIRQNNGVPYFYNTDDYVYAPELDLYLRIAADNFSAYHTATADVIREPGSGNTAHVWKYFADKFYVIEHFKTHPFISEAMYRKNYLFQTYTASKRFLFANYLKKGDANSIAEGLKNYYSQKNIFLNLLFKVWWAMVLVANKTGVIKLIKA